LKRSPLVGHRDWKKLRVWLKLLFLKTSTFDWKDGLPDDEQEVTQNEGAKIHCRTYPVLKVRSGGCMAWRVKPCRKKVDRIRGEQAGQGTTELPPITLPPAEGEDAGEE